MIVALHCTRFSRAILIARHGDEPIRVDRSDVLFTELQSVPARSPQQRLSSASDALPCTVRLEVPTALGRFLSAHHRARLVGLHLYKFHVHEMLTFAEAQHLAGIPVQQALRTFLHLHDVEEDDLGLDTAYKAWQRRRQRRAKELCARLQRNPVPLRPGKLRDHYEDPRRIIRAVAQAYEAPITMLVARAVVIRRPYGRFRYHYDARLGASRYYVQARAMYAYLLWLDAGFSSAAIASQFIRLDESQIRRLIRGLRHQLSYSEAVQERLARCRALLAAWRGANGGSVSGLSSPYVHAV